MKIRRRHIILVTIFTLYLAARLLFALQTPYFEDDQSYFALRQVSHITETGRPLYEDTLSLGGREFAFMPLYYYLLAPFYAYFPGPLTLKIVNNVFASTIVIAVYILMRKIVQNRRIALLCSLLAATIPIYIGETLNRINPTSLLVPGVLFFAYFFLRLDDEKNISLLILLSLLLIMTTSSSVILALSILIFAILSYLEDIKPERILQEFEVFFLFLFLWANFIVYKVAFQRQGFSILWRSIPQPLLARYFTDLSLYESITSVGIITLILGSLTIYRFLFKKKSKNIYFFISIFISSTVLVALRLAQPEVGLVFMGTSLVVLFGQFFRDFISTLKKTKFAARRTLIISGLLGLLFAVQVVPSFFAMAEHVRTTPKQEYFDAFTWLRTLPEDSVIASHPSEGHLITYFGNRTNMVDSTYLLMEQPEDRLEDIRIIFTSPFRIRALRVLEQYNVSHILFSSVTQDTFEVERIPYVEDECFDLIYNKSVKIYAVGECQIKE